MNHIEEMERKYYGKNYDYVMNLVKEDVALEKKQFKKNIHMQTYQNLILKLILIKMELFKVIIFGLKMKMEFQQTLDPTHLNMIQI